MIARGDVCWVDLGSVAGSAPALRRPVVVVQSDSFNRSALGTALVVAVTSNTSLAEYPGNVFLPSGVSELARDSVVNVTQLATVDKDDLDPTGVALPPYLLDDVDRGLRLVLAL